MQGSNRVGATRRDVLRGGMRLALAAPLAGLASSTWLAGCGSGDEPAKAPPAAPPSPPAPAAEPKPAPAPAAPQPPAAPPPTPEPVAHGDGGGPLVTDLAAAAPMVAALQYTNTSQTAGQNCAGCQLYTPTADGLGKCQLFAEGLVKEGGWCASWAAKVD